MDEAKYPDWTVEDFDTGQKVSPRDHPRCWQKTVEACRPFPDLIAEVRNDLMQHPPAGWERYYAVVKDVCQRNFFDMCSGPWPTGDVVTVGTVEFVGIHEECLESGRDEEDCPLQVYGTVPIDGNVAARTIRLAWDRLSTYWDFLKDI